MYCWENVVYTNICTYVFKRRIYIIVSVCIHMYMSVSIYKYMFRHIRIRICIQTHTDGMTYIKVSYIFMYKCIDIYIHICI